MHVEDFAHLVARGWKVGLEKHGIVMLGVRHQIVLAQYNLQVIDVYVLLPWAHLTLCYGAQHILNAIIVASFVEYVPERLDQGQRSLDIAHSFLGFLL